MPKNKTGGKKSRKKSSKHEYDELDEKNICKPDEFQEYGMITKIQGNSRMLVDCLSKINIDGKEERIIKNRMATIRGKLKKRAWMDVGDIVIVSLRDFKDERGDIIHKYSSQQSNYLRKIKEIPNDFGRKDDNKQEKLTRISENDAFDFEDNSDDDNQNYVNVGKQKLMDFPSSESSDESENEDNQQININNI